MGKRTLIFVGFLFLLCTCVTDDGDSYRRHFTRYYGNDGDHFGADVVVNPDGSVVVLGTAEFPANSGLRRIYLAKADKDGNTLWEKVFGDFNENAKDIEPITSGTYAGGYYILSNTLTDAIAGTTMIKVLRVDANGDKIGTDSLLLDDPLYQPSNYATSITAWSDGGFAVIGNTTADILTGEGLANPPDQTDLLILKYGENFIKDASGAIFETIGGAPEVMGIKIFQLTGADFFYAAYTNGIHSGEASAPVKYDFEFWYARVVSSEYEEKYEGDTLLQEKMSAISSITSFGDYFAIGSVDATGGTQKIFVSRFLSSFADTEKDSAVYDFPGEGIAVATTGSAGALIAGNQVTPGGSRDIWVNKVNRNLITESGFPVTFGAAGNDDTASAIAELPNGDVVILGTMTLINQSKIALIKIKSNGGF